MRGCGEERRGDQCALALRFDPAPWPEALQAEGLESGYALALNLVSAAPWSHHTRAHHEPQRRASDHLEAAVRKRGISVLRALSRRADWDFASAVRAYAKARGRAPREILAPDLRPATSDQRPTPPTPGSRVRAG
jgi:hypothetical protein